LTAYLKQLFVAAALGVASLLAPITIAQPLVLSAIQVDAGNTKATGATFGYRLAYNCSSSSGPCLGAEVVQLLPAAVTLVSTVPASPSGDVSAINVTPNFMGSGRTRVQFVMTSPLTAGNAGDLLVNVRFNNGSTPNTTMATATADGINLGATPGTLTTPPVSVTAVAILQATPQKTLTTAPANLDLPESYRLRISNPTANGVLNLTAIGPVVDTLPPGTVFSGATPAADCQPGCVGTTPATVTWTSPCALPLVPGGTCDVQVNVVFPSATFASGSNVSNIFHTTVTPLAEPAQSLAPASVAHPVTTFVAAPAATINKTLSGTSPNPPTLNQAFSYAIAVANSGNVALDNATVIDTLPVEFQPASVTTGAYSGAADFAAGEGVRVSYEKNTAPGVFTLWGSSPNTTTTTTLTAPPPGLGAGEYITRLRWQHGQWQPGMSATTQPSLNGSIINPDHAGGPVAIGDSIQNCAALSATYTAGPTAVSGNSCRSFNLSGPFVQLNPGVDNLSGGGPFNPAQNISWRVRVRSAAQSSDPLPLQSTAAMVLLPLGLNFTSWTFDDSGTGLPSPQTFSGALSNFAGSGRTLLRWTWSAGSGNLGVNQEVRINVTTTVAGTVGGNLALDAALAANTAALAQRCSTSSNTDTLDQDNDGSTTDTLCTASASATVLTPPAFTSAPPPGATIGDSYNYTVTASGSPAPNFSLASGALPPALSLDGATGVISGTATTAGTFNGALRASNQLGTVTQPFSITIARRAQTISFGANPGPVAFAPGATVNVTATATSMLLVSFSSLTPALCSVNAGTVTLLAAGTCTVQADQAGDATYLPAAAVTQGIVVQQGAQTISFGANPGPVPYAPGATVTVTATATSLLTVSLSSLTAAVCSINQNTVTLLAAGTCTIQATQAGDGNYLAAPAVTQSIVVQQAAQTITFNPPSPVSFAAGAASTLTATSSSGLTAFTFTTTTPAVCSVTGNTLTLLAVGSCALTAAQAGDGNYLPATANATVVINAVISFTGNTATGTGPATASFTGGGAGCSFDLGQTGFVNATAAPASGNFPHGWFRFRLQGCTTGATVRMSIQWPSLPFDGGYLKYGRTPASGGTTVFYAPANLSATANTVQFDVTDGALGDDDLSANGVIVDPSGPLALPPLPVPASGVVPAALLLLLAAAMTLLRRRRAPSPAA